MRLLLKSVARFITRNNAFCSNICRLCTNMTPLPASSLTVFTSVVNNPQIKFLEELFKKSGFELRIAGGAVRDLLLGKTPHDIDFATTATPQEMIGMMSVHEDRIRLILTLAGQRHGTVTARIDQASQYEITTLRTDKITDGRHAEVEFIKDWKLDASRRDLTINSMFLDLEGNLYDYFNGRLDLESQKIRFVGDPIARIREDYLRILRYFRFFARYGNEKHDEHTLQAIEENIDGLNQISGERIWQELKRILCIKTCDLVIPVMFNKMKMGKHIGFLDSQNLDLSEFRNVHSNLKTTSMAYEPITLLVSLIRSVEELTSVATRLKFSNMEKNIASYVIHNREDSVTDTKSMKRRLAVASKTDFTILKRSTLEFLKYSGNPKTLLEIEDWTPPEFPIRGTDVVQKVKNRKIIGKVLEELRKRWANSDFSVSEDQLLEELDSIIRSFSDTSQPVKRKSSEC